MTHDPPTHLHVEPPSLEHITEVVARRRRNRYRLVTGSVGTVVIGGLAYAGLSDGEPSYEGPAASSVVPTTATTVQSEEPANVTTLPDSGSPRWTPPVTVCSEQGDDWESKPTWFTEAADAVSVSGADAIDYARVIAATWDVDIIEAKALTRLVPAEMLSAPTPADHVSEFGRRQAEAREQLVVLSQAWNIDPVALKVMAVGEVQPLLDQLDQVRGDELTAADVQAATACGE